jgi:predicted aconitase with swiveling domain
MGETFRGRPVVPGAATGRALVSCEPFDALASFGESLIQGQRPAVSRDRRNVAIWECDLTGSVLCVPAAIGSTSAGATWDLVAHHHLEPAAVLFARSIDSLSAGGLVVASEWEASSIVVVDELGERFLQSVSSGMVVSVEPDGSVHVGRQVDAS